MAIFLKVRKFFENLVVSFFIASIILVFVFNLLRQKSEKSQDKLNET